MNKQFILLPCIFLFFLQTTFAQSFIEDTKVVGGLALVDAQEMAEICVANNDHAVVLKAVSLLRQDIEMVAGKKLPLINKIPAKAKTVLIIGSLDRSSIIKNLVNEKKLDISKIKNKWEAFQIQLIKNPYKGISQALVIVGSDRRGTAFGVFELSRQIGVSPWYWWADVPMKRKSALYIKPATFIVEAPKVKYRGIFINDEAPALSNWSREKFGGFNSKFYAKVFELMLRLKSNYIWPAMWGNAFYDDDSLNIKTADEYAIVIGTSHHEPLMRAHDEWRRYGKGLWDYDSNEVRLKEFWKQGMIRATNEKIVSIGMRGDGDKPMSRETATALLERIVKDQRQIIEKVTGKSASQTPQLWALYKEVQDYYDKGMRVPDDVTLLLCDDNWGNIRRLPKLNEKPRKGGYGIYYHFDYVGGPRNYKWLNTNPLPRVWEQMHLAWKYNVKNIWIVNVGDIKPMEFPISFFLDYAWDPEKIGPADLQAYTEQWSAEQFGNKYAKEIASILSRYTKYNGRRKPELLDANTYSLRGLPDHSEFDHVVQEYNELLTEAEQINTELAPEYKDAFFQLVLHPVRACANLNEMYLNVAKNRLYARMGLSLANDYADKVKELYTRDSLITLQYHTIANGKWNHLMSQTHIGYTYWQQPPHNSMPMVKYVSPDSAIKGFTPPFIIKDVESSRSIVPAMVRRNVFYAEGNCVSIEANHYTKAINTNGIVWTVLPDHGRTGSAITPFPVTASAQVLNTQTPHLEYEMYFNSEMDSATVWAYFSPTLNFHNDDGLKYAISIDDGEPQIISINKDDNNVRLWNEWVANNIILKTSKHVIHGNGKHVLKFWMIDPGVVLQKLVVYQEVPPPSYLGPLETLIK